MKTSLLIAVLTLSASAFAATTTKTRLVATTPAATETSSVTTRQTLLTGQPTERKFYLSANLVALANSTGNASIDFFTTDKISVGLRFEASSNKEFNKKQNRKVPTDRTMYGVGGSYWVLGNAAQRGLLISPFLAFGTKKDNADVETLSGFGLKATAVARLNRDLTGEVGLLGHTLDDGDFKGNLYAGVGFLF